ncbi:hypothetical protein QUF79_20440 [Fictibacillus enclensis]|nr:hypothetical protein [Fictibacillus enclensis]
MNQYISKYVEHGLDKSQQEQLKHVLKFIWKENPYQEEGITLTQLLSYIIDECIDHTRYAKQAVEKWLDTVIEKD